MGAQAKQNGLVDQLGGLNEAIEIVRKKAGLSATGETNLVMYPPRRSLFELLSNTTPETLGDAAARANCGPCCRTFRATPSSREGYCAYCLIV